MPAKLFHYIKPINHCGSTAISQLY